MRSRIAIAAVMALGTLAATAGVAEARDGCGIGGHRGYYGYCRPNLGPRPFVGYRGFYGPPRAYGWHGPRWGGYRHVGWRHHGWHHRW